MNDYTLIVISGTHRTGKTTLMEEFIKQNPEFQMLPFTVTNVWHEVFGNRPYTMDLPAADRVLFQYGLLNAWTLCVMDHVAQGGKWIIDRGPLDFASYMRLTLIDCMSHEVNLQAEHFVTNCIQATASLISYEILVSPALHRINGEMVEDDITKLTGKVGLMNQTVFHSILRDVAQDTLRSSICSGYSVGQLINLQELPSNILDLQDRVNWLREVIDAKSKGKARLQPTG
ncbi:hypothetical protein Peetri_00213 [Pseudomonas phage vB_PpuM-Peetri]